MKAINGSLDMSKSYKLIDVEYGEINEMACENCQNCGNIISNIAIVEQEGGNKYRIGLDCMKVLVKMLPSDKQQARNKINKERKFLKHLKTEAKCIVVNDRNNAFTYIKPQTKWQSFWRYRFIYSKWQDVIKRLNIPVIIDLN